VPSSPMISPTHLQSFVFCQRMSDSLQVVVAPGQKSVNEPTLIGIYSLTSGDRWRGSQHAIDGMLKL
jgi:hypothetical protein